MVTQKKIIFFSPYANIWVHAFPESLIVKTLLKENYSVTVVGCRGALSKRCTTFEALGIRGAIPPSLSQKICSLCVKKQHRLDKHLGVERFWLDDFIEKQDFKNTDRLIESTQDSLLKDINKLGLPIGRFATYEVLLTFKKLDLSFKENELIEYKAHLRGCILALQGMSRLLMQKKEVSHFFTYNSLYGVNRTVSSLAQSKGIKTYCLHAGNHSVNRYKTLSIAPKTQLSHLHYLTSIWLHFSSVSCSAKNIEIVTAHLLEKFRGRDLWAYSKPVKTLVSIREKFGINKDARIFLAVMSSYDERFSAESTGLRFDNNETLFRSQKDWINWLIEYVSKNTDFFLIIRVHPREFPNKRESVLSYHAQMLMSEFNKLPDNVKVNWPTDDISLYEIATQVDVVLNAWSTVGNELSMLGIPVVFYSSNPKFINYPPPDPKLVGGDSIQSYEIAINHALSEGWSFSRIRRTYRWLALELVYSVLDISDVFDPTKTTKMNPLFSKILNKVQSIINPYWKIDKDCQNFPKHLAQHDIVVKMIEEEKQSIAEIQFISSSSLEEEEKNIILSLRKIIDSLNVNKDGSSPVMKSLLDFIDSKSDIS